MWSIRKENSKCAAVRDTLENSPQSAGTQSESPALSPEQRSHFASCPDCQAGADERLTSSFLLRRLPKTAAPDAWFAPRVTAAITARESELRQSLETWAVLPRLAARLTWVSALALLLMGTWVFESPRFARNGNQSGSESLFESPQPDASDDVLLSMDRQ